MVDDIVNRYARELIEAIHSAVAQDRVVQACRERARAAGIELTISLEAVIGVADLDAAAARTGAAAVPRSCRPAPMRRPHEITAADRRFLRSLGIHPTEETPEDA